MTSRINALYSVIERTGAPDIRQLAAKPGCQSVHRVTCYYADGSAHHSIATLTASQRYDYTLNVIYETLFDHQPMTYAIERRAYEGLIAAFSRARFDQLPDQQEPDKPVSLWMVERATGAFHKRLVVCPDVPEPPYSLIVNAIDDFLPEATRKIT